MAERAGVTRPSPQDYVYVEPALDYRLRNWARWARVRHWLSSACRSIEGRYRPEAGDVWDRDLRPLPVDSLDAWAIECTWRTGLPLRERAIVRAYYVTAPVSSPGAWEAHKRKTCRMLSIARGAWAYDVGRAITMLGTRLQSVDFSRRIRSSYPPIGRDRVDASAMEASAFQKAEE
jgi:hypothetical protein